HSNAVWKASIVCAIVCLVRTLGIGESEADILIPNGDGDVSGLVVTRESLGCVHWTVGCISGGGGKYSALACLDRHLIVDVKLLEFPSASQGGGVCSRLQSSPYQRDVSAVNGEGEHP